METNVFSLQSAPVLTDQTNGNTTAILVMLFSLIIVGIVIWRYRIIDKQEREINRSKYKNTKKSSD